MGIHIYKINFLIAVKYLSERDQTISGYYSQWKWGVIEVIYILQGRNDASTVDLKLTFSGSKYEPWGRCLVSH